MRNRAVWWTINVLILLALLFVSCGPRAAPVREPGATPIPAAPAPVTPTTTAPVAPAPTPTPTTAEKPKYGGTLNLVSTTNWEVFCPACVPRGTNLGGIVYEQFIEPDWTKGKAGTGEISLGLTGGAPSYDYLTGHLAEKWAVPQLGVWVLDMRKGIHFALDPASEASRLANGREMTVDDAVWSIQYLKDEARSWINLSQPGLVKNYTVEKTGPAQLTLKTPVDPGVTYCWILGGGGSQYVWAPEVIKKYGGTSDWRHSVGTGAYMITDFISDSVATLKKNPNYWAKNPIGPGKGDQLPYPDQLKYFFIVDLSTRLAAMRTGRVDWLEAIQAEDAESVLKSNPNIQGYQYPGTTLLVAMRTDKAELPYKDIRVRQALMLATDLETIKRDLYGGKAEIYSIPVDITAEVARPKFEELPQKVQELFKYNPQKAKQLLAEAGYPNGFKAKMIVQNISTEMDLASIFKAMWLKVGVDIELQPRDGAVYRALNSARSHEDIILRTATQLGGLSGRYVFSGYRSASVNNPSYINDPPGKDAVIEKAFQEIQKVIGVDNRKADQFIRDVVPHIIEQAYYIPAPAPYVYRLAQPWLKNYHGEATNDFLYRVWIDQDLKEKLTGRR